jgi:thiol-disulfide isomerase/thioredoxin
METFDPIPDEPLPETLDDASSWRRPLGWLTLLVVGVVVVGVLVLRDGGDDAAGPTVPTLPDAGDNLPGATGDTAPDFSIELIGGGRFHLSEHLETDGRPVILNLWASWCGPCRAEMPDLSAAALAHPEVQFLGVAVEDDPIAAERFAEEIGVSYPLAIDNADRVARRYPSPGLPATYLISSEGRVIRIVYGQIREAQIEVLIEQLTG